MDAFFASVEQRDNPDLRGKPVAVGYDGERGVVSTASYEARKYGVHSAMSMLVAKRLCPQLIVVRGSYENYSFWNTSRATATVSAMSCSVWAALTKPAS